MSKRIKLQKGSVLVVTGHGVPVFLWLHWNHISNLSDEKL